uniref:Rif1_N domain-containing protein n=1 Tax=Elaeophora elaphi TaxID=1147741 RepID=A0A0R3RRT8_9BILA
MRQLRSALDQSSEPPKKPTVFRDNNHPKYQEDEKKKSTPKMGVKSSPKMNIKNASKKVSYISPFLVHQQPDVLNDIGEDGSLPIRDEWLDITNRIDEHSSVEELAYDSASKMAYLIRERLNDESCKSSVAACDAHTSMWPQINGLCDLFFVKCLVEVAGMICRNYTEKDIFKYASDLCDNVSDFCTQNREATISFCWTYLYHRYGEVSMNPQPPKTGLDRFVESFI